MDFSEALEKSLHCLRKIEKVRLLDSSERLYADFRKEDVICLVETEVCGKDYERLPIKFHIKFSKDFPLSIPSVYLVKHSYETLKYIPHLDTKKMVCTFDNKAVANPRFPGEMVMEVLGKAKRIIEDGVQGRNLEDFENEFEAYWGNKYSKKDSCRTVLNLIENEVCDTFKVMRLESKIAGHGVIFHNGSNSARELKTYLEGQNKRYKEGKGFYLGRLCGIDQPPFSMTNGDVLKIVEKEVPHLLPEYENYINQVKDENYILFSKIINGESKFFAWRHALDDRKIMGIRKGLQPWDLLKTVYINTSVRRLLPEVYTANRLQKRTAGKKTKTQKYAFVGLGSIGSHLIPYLNDKHSVEFRLIDSDVFGLENIARHLLGANYVGYPKVEALKQFLKDLAPLQPISIRNSSIFEVVQNEPEYLNDLDLTFVAVGEPTIENWLAEKLTEGSLTKPMVFLWVEPFLLGGHMIYLSPQDVSYQKFFDIHGSFIGNVIDATDYDNPVLQKQEAGCQTLYTPYSAQDIHLYLGALFPKILDLLKNPSSKTVSYTFIGDKEVAADLGILLSNHILNIPSGSVIINYA